MAEKSIVFTVTNDLSYDQRMQRICSTLAKHGYAVILVGRVLPNSATPDRQPYAQHRIKCRFHKGFRFYAEYNMRLFAYLLDARYDAVCSIDLDTLAAGCLASLLRGKKRVYDAHEYFTEVPEVTRRPLVKAFWALIARLCLPFYRYAYTVGPALAAILGRKYRIPFAVIRNVPFKQSFAPVTPEKPPVLLYQGALNEGRGIEPLLAAMQMLENIELWLAGEGDLSASLRRQAIDLGVQEKVRFLGYVKPADLKALTRRAWLGLNFFEKKGLNYYYSMANKFFDYVQAGIPVLTVNFPEYRTLNTRHEVAVLLDDLLPDTIASTIQHLQKNPNFYQRLQINTRAAAEEWNWEREEKVLLQFWDKVFSKPAGY